MSRSKNKFQDINLQNIEKLLNQQTVVILGAVDRKINKLEERINKKIDKLITLKEKLGVEIA